MKAILCKTFGAPETLTFEEVDSPIISAGKIRINVKSVSLNFPDTLIIQNKYQFKPELPFSPGGEVAGEIIEIGEGVKHLKVGMRVCALTGWGGLAEEVVTDAQRVLPIPDSMDFSVASCMLYIYGTAYHALKDRANLQANETILILGAAGGVGLAAVELAKNMGATVIAAASTEEKLKVCAARGADYCINYSQSDWRDKIKNIVGNKGVDVVFDPVGDALTEPVVRMLAWRGRYLVVGFAGGEIPKIPLNLVLLKGASLVGVFWGSFTEKQPRENLKNMQELFALYEQGKLFPYTQKKYSLAETPQALNDLICRRAIGKIVIVTDTHIVSLPQPKPQYIEPISENSKLIFNTPKDLFPFIGKELGVSDWTMITQDLIQLFADATGDHQWIHLDEERCKIESPYKQTIAHGLLTLSLSPQWIYKLYSITNCKLMVNYGFNRVRFIQPVLSGSKVRLRCSLKNIEHNNGSYTLTHSCVFETEGVEKPVCVAEWLAVVG